MWIGFNAKKTRFKWKLYPSVLLCIHYSFKCRLRRTYLCHCWWKYHPASKKMEIRDRRRDKYEVYQVGLVWTRALGSWSCSPLALGWSGSPWSNPSWDVRHCDHHDRDHHRNVQCQFPLSYYILHKIWSVMPTCKILLLVHRHDQRSLREEFEVVHRLSH